MFVFATANAPFPIEKLRPEAMIVAAPAARLPLPEIVALTMRPEPVIVAAPETRLPLPLDSDLPEPSISATPAARAPFPRDSDLPEPAMVAAAAAKAPLPRRSATLPEPAIVAAPVARLPLPADLERPEPLICAAWAPRLPLPVGFPVAAGLTATVAAHQESSVPPTISAYVPGSSAPGDVISRDAIMTLLVEAF